MEAKQNSNEGRAGNKIYVYQVVKSLRNWARERARKADSKGTFKGIMDGCNESDATLDDPSTVVKASSIETQSQNAATQSQRRNNK